MIILIYTKNFALTHTVEIETSVVPRIGETITLEQYPNDVQGVKELLVHNVTYILKDDTLTPSVSCHGSNGQINRRAILDENGWL